MNLNFNFYYSKNIKINGDVRYQIDTISLLKKNGFNINLGKKKIQWIKSSIIKNISLFKPELRIYDQPLVVTSEADIKTTLFKDEFLVMNKIKGNEYFNVRYQVKPFMIWIWISTMLLAIGGILSLYNRLYA